MKNYSPTDAKIAASTFPAREQGRDNYAIFKIFFENCLYATYLMSVSLSGVSSLQWACELGSAQEAAWRLGHTRSEPLEIKVGYLRPLAPSKLMNLR